MRISPESAGWAPESTLDQRRLAGAVAADEGDDLAGIEVDADAVDGVDAAEGHADVAHLDERGRPPVGVVAASLIVTLAHARRSMHRPRRCRAATASRPTATTSTIADDDVLGRRVDLQQHHARAQRLHDHRPSTAPGIVPMPPANDVPPMTAAAITSSSFWTPRLVTARVEPRRLDGRADRDQDAHEDEREHDRPADVDAAQLGRLGVAADGVDVAAEAAAGRDRS